MKAIKQESRIFRKLPACFVFLPIHLFAFGSACFVSAADKPNIIIFLADDLGYADNRVSASPSVDGDPANVVAQRLDADHPARQSMERLQDPPEWELYDL